MEDSSGANADPVHPTDLPGLVMSGRCGAAETPD